MCCFNLILVLCFWLNLLSVVRKYTMHQQIPLKKLRKDIHTTFKSWDEAIRDTSPLDYLFLVRQATFDDDVSIHRATNELILRGLETLATEYEDSQTVLREHYFDGELMHAMANRRNVAQSTIYRRQDQALNQLADIIHAMEQQAVAEYQTSLEKRLKLPPETQTFGIAERQAEVIAQITNAGSPWLISIEGLGGIGKTTLASSIARNPALMGHFKKIAWVSAKQREYLPGVGLDDEESAALTEAQLIDRLLEQFDHTEVLLQSAPEKRNALIQLLKSESYLIFIDNLETVVDYQTLIPLLWDIVNPSKVILTSRHSIQAYPNIFCYALTELNRTDSFQLIIQEADRRGIPDLAKASETQLERIHAVVGGNPLAIKLVVGQTAFLALPHVLDNLKDAQGQSVLDLYTHIYHQVWALLSPQSRQVLLIMPLAQDGALQQLLTLSELEPAPLHEALQQLAVLSLVQVEGNLEERYYTIHRLTETFLLNEKIKWRVPE